MDTLRFRADSAINQVIRSLARLPAVRLVDAEQECARQSTGAIPGQDLFYDHVHLNFRGTYVVAALCARAIKQELAPAAPRVIAEPLPPEEDIRAALAFTEFDARRILEEMRLRLQQPPFSSQSNFRPRDERLRECLLGMPAAPADGIPAYHAATARAPEDGTLRVNFARLLDATRDTAGATLQWKEAGRLLPFEPEPSFQLGELALSAGDSQQARQWFGRALRLDPCCVEALDGLAQAEAAQGQVRPALEHYQTALRLKPRFSGARVNLAVLLAQTGKTQDAIAQYQTTLRQDTNNVAARINLAKLFVAQGNSDEGIRLYLEALQLNSNEPIAHFNLGNALLAKGGHAEALQHYAAAVQAKPEFAEARLQLALELARQGNIVEALPHLAEVVRLQPNSVEGHFNYGVALAKLERYSAAAREFRATLNLRPDYPSARAMLERASQLAAKARAAP